MAHRHVIVAAALGLSPCATWPLPLLRRPASPAGRPGPTRGPPGPVAAACRSARESPSFASRSPAELLRHLALRPPRRRHPASSPPRCRPPPRRASSAGGRRPPPFAPAPHRRAASAGGRRSSGTARCTSPRLFQAPATTDMNSGESAAASKSALDLDLKPSSVDFLVPNPIYLAYFDLLYLRIRSSDSCI